MDHDRDRRDDGETREQGDNVRYLPNTAPGRQVEPREAGEVIEGEIVDEGDYPRLPERQKAALRWRGYRHDVAATGRVIRTAATHPRTRTTGRTVARHSAYVAAGAGVAARRVWEAHTSSRYERMMRAAEATGDLDKVAEWEERERAAKRERHQRAMDWLQAPIQLVKAAAIGTAAFVGLLLGLGVILAVADGQAGRVIDPIVGVVEFVRWAVWFVSAFGLLLSLAAGALVVAILWHLGRQSGRMPTWVQPPTQEKTTGAVVTPSVVVTALRDLGVSELKRAIQQMGDAGAGMLGPITIAGCGVEVDVTLPSGVSTDDVSRRRRKLAENLDRHEHEVHITIPQAARTVRLWIADSGALDEPIGPSPLVVDEEASADLYTGRAPWGQNLRGDAALVSLLQRHLLMTGLSNQGKTAALRALALWLVLDATTELHIADLKGVGDWKMFSGLATTLIEGPGDGHVTQATEMLEAGVREMERRNEALRNSGSTEGITRSMARGGQGFHPLFVIVDEAQVAFMCPIKDEAGNPYGGTTARSRYFMAARKIHNQGRAVNVHLWQGTQDPTDQNLPKLVREGAHIRASLVVGTESQGRMALGDKAVDQGAAPHKLRSGPDKGVLVVTGDGVDIPHGQSATTIRTHFIGGDDATTIADRARTRRRPVATRTTIDVDQPRDILADVAHVLDGQRVRAKDVAARLRALAPEYAPYRDITGVGVEQALAQHGVRIIRPANVPTVEPDTVRDALAARHSDDGEVS